MLSNPPTPHSAPTDATPPSVQLFTIPNTGLGPYVALPVTSPWADDTAHLFTRETTQQIVSDLTRDDPCMSARFAADGTLTLQWTEDDTMGRVNVVTPDAHDRYLLGGMWPWTPWDDDAPHTPGQAAYARGATDHRDTVTTHHPDALINAYNQGREEAHRVTLHRGDPSTEHTYALSAYAHAAARALGPGWGATPGYLGAWGLIHRQGTTIALRLYVDSDDDRLGLDGSIEQYIETAALPDSPPHNPAQLAIWGRAIATEIREAFPDA